VAIKAARALPRTNFPGADFVEVENVCVMEAEHASAFLAGKDANWRKIDGLGYNGAAVSVFPVTVPMRLSPEKIKAESPCLEFKLWLQHFGEWQVTLRALPTFSVETGKPQRYAIAFDDAPPQIVFLPVGTGEKDRQWQENVLRNAALTTSRHALPTNGLHTLKIWMVDPGLVIDAIATRNHDALPLEYVWPTETSVTAVK
jgi:hypothetical protein